MDDSLKQFILYTAPNGEVRVDVLLQDEMLWLSQKAMALLFDCSSDNVSLHLKNIFESNELEENSVTEVFSTTASDGKTYKVKHYSLDAIISVGYRVNQHSQFIIHHSQFKKHGFKKLATRSRQLD